MRLLTLIHVEMCLCVCISIASFPRMNMENEIVEMHSVGPQCWECSVETLY